MRTDHLGAALPGLTGTLSILIFDLRDWRLTAETSVLFAEGSALPGLQKTLSETRLSCDSRMVMGGLAAL